MVMLTFTVDKNNKLIDVKKSKEKGLFESKKDQEYANKILKKLKKKKKWEFYDYNKKKKSLLMYMINYIKEWLVHHKLELLILLNPLVLIKSLCLFVKHTQPVELINGDSWQQLKLVLLLVSQPTLFIINFLIFLYVKKVII